MDSLSGNPGVAPTMKPLTASFAYALRTARRARGVPQEEFDTVSSRTYVSAIERGLKQPTVAKVDALAGILGIHPLSLLALAYSKGRTSAEMRSMLDRVRAEVDELIVERSRD